MNVKSSSLRKAKHEPTIQRTSISKMGRIVEKKIPINHLKKEAIDLSADSSSPQSLFLTREAAMKITEEALAKALGVNEWSKLITQIPSDGEVMIDKQADEHKDPITDKQVTSDSIKNPKVNDESHAKRYYSQTTKLTDREKKEINKTRSPNVQTDFKTNGRISRPKSLPTSMKQSSSSYNSPNSKGTTPKANEERSHPNKFS